MIRSKISRSFMVAIFIVMIIFLGYLDIRYMLNAPQQSVTVKLIKIGYVFAIIMLVLIYVYIKDKLYKIKFKRSHSLILRYIYLLIAIVITNLLSLYKNLYKIEINMILVYLILTIISAFIIKKVIFNVSKSDILSVVAVFAFSMLPIIYTNMYVYVNSLLIVLFVFATILNLQMLIDELKQRGIKTVKYLILACTLGIFMGITCVLGINFCVWCLAFSILLIITINLDNTHINFPKKVMYSMTQENRERLYRVERINISKLLICILISLVIMFAIYFIGNIICDRIANMSNNIFIHIINNNINNNNVIKNNFIDFSFGKFIKDSKQFIQFSKGYYMVLFIYIILVESLNILLKRRYDTKSTILKTIFVLSFICMSIFNINIYIMQPLFTIMLVLIAIVNTSNIYLNREERVKMLVA